jgi:hypothetical protein
LRRAYRGRERRRAEKCSRKKRQQGPNDPHHTTPSHQPPG